MATYVNDLRLKEIGTGESSGTWGTETNTNLELIGEALGYATEGITTNADTHATTVADGSTDPGRAMYIKYTGTLDSACTITIGPNTMSRVHIIENATSGSQNIIIKQGSGAEITIPNGYVKVVYLDGAGSGAAVTEAFDNLSVGTNFRIGNGAAEDTSLVFDGNAQDFYIGLDDSADDLIIGLGSTVGTTPIISVDENKDVAIPDGGLTITTDDNTTQLTLKSTDADATEGPNLDFTRDSGSPADDDVLGRIRFLGDNDAGGALTYARIFTTIRDASNGTEDGMLSFNTVSGGANRSRLELDSTETVFNEGGASDIDFRVESDNFSHLFFIDASADGVGIGDGGTQAGGLKIQSATSTTDDIDVKLYLNARTTGTPTTNFGPGIVFAGDRNSDNATQQMARINAIAEVNSGTTLSSGLQFMTATAGTNSEKFRISNDGVVSIGASQEAKMFISSTDRFNLATADGLGIQLDKDNNRIAPVDASGSYNNNVSLGSSSLPFKDLHIDRIYSALTTITRDDNSAGLQLVSTDTDSANGPMIDLSRDNSSAADGDVLGTIRFRGDDSVNSQTTYAQIHAKIVDASNGTEDGSLHINTMAAGTSTETMSFHSGNVSLPSQVATGTLPQGRLEVVAAADSNCINTQVATAGNFTSFASSGPTSSGGNTYQYGRMINSSGSQAGTIVVNHSSVTYNTTSDYRLKENVTGLTSATTRLQQLQPKRFNFIEVPDKTVDGFLAHEVSSVVPEAVTGEKDAVDADGNPDYQGIDQSKLVPLLVAAIQEQQTLIETLQTKVAALEGA